ALHVLVDKLGRLEPVNLSGHRPQRRAAAGQADALHKAILTRPLLLLQRRGWEQDAALVRHPAPTIRASYNAVPARGVGRPPLRPQLGTVAADDEPAVAWRRRMFEKHRQLAVVLDVPHLGAGHRLDNLPLPLLRQLARAHDERP